MLASGFWSGEAFLDVGALIFVLVAVGVVGYVRRHRRSSGDDESS
jgi:hypothetical protein